MTELIFGISFELLLEVQHMLEIPVALFPNTATKISDEYAEPEGFFTVFAGRTHPTQ